VILIDASVLIYAHVSSFAQYERTRDWFDRQLSGTAPVGLPWASVPAFLRLVTNPRVLDIAYGEGNVMIRNPLSAIHPGQDGTVDTHRGVV
jgi:predicted nucleic acid-binding protein